MTKQDDFLHFISPEHLYFGAAVFGSITVVIVVMIYIYLYVKKRSFFKKQKISKQLNQWISDALLENSNIDVKLTLRLERYFKKETNRQFVTDNLINIKKNIFGAAADNIIRLYEQLGLKQDSVSKLKSIAWHRKSRGIYELYMMQQRDMLPEITKNINSGNEQVRMEAHTALVGFEGFAGLDFLNYLTYPMNDWQQIKLLEQLRTLDPGNMEDLPAWLNSSNEYVVLFALKLTDIYQQLHVHDKVLSILESKNEKLRYQAIKTLGRIANVDTAAILKNHYPAETEANKKQILKQLSMIGTEYDIRFLTERMTADTDSLKLEAGRAIMRISNNGMAIIDECAGGNDILQSVSKQIKYESAR